MNCRWQRVRWFGTGGFVPGRIERQKTTRAAVARELRHTPHWALVLRSGRSWMRLGDLAHWLSWVEEDGK